MQCQDIRETQGSSFLQRLSDAAGRLRESLLWISHLPSDLQPYPFPLYLCFPPFSSQAEPADLAGISGFYFAVVRRSQRAASEGPTPPGSVDLSAVSMAQHGTAWHSMAWHALGQCSVALRGAAQRFMLSADMCCPCVPAPRLAPCSTTRSNPTRGKRASVESVNSSSAAGFTPHGFEGHFYSLCLPTPNNPQTAEASPRRVPDQQLRKRAGGPAAPRLPGQLRRQLRQLLPPLWPGAQC